MHAHWPERDDKNVSPAYPRNVLSVLTAKVPVEWKKQLPKWTDQSEIRLKFEIKFSL